MNIAMKVCLTLVDIDKKTIHQWICCAMACPRTRGSSLQVVYPGDTGVNRLSQQQGKGLAVQGCLLPWGLCFPSCLRLCHSNIYIDSHAFAR